MVVILVAIAARVVAGRMAVVLLAPTVMVQRTVRVIWVAHGLPAIRTVHELTATVTRAAHTPTVTTVPVTARTAVARSAVLVLWVLAVVALVVAVLLAVAVAVRTVVADSPLMVLFN